MAWLGELGRIEQNIVRNQRYKKYIIDSRDPEEVLSEVKTENQALKFIGEEPLKELTQKPTSGTIYKSTDRMASLNPKIKTQKTFRGTTYDTSFWDPAYRLVHQMKKREEEENPKPQFPEQKGLF